MSVEIYPSIAKIKRNGVYENLPGFVPESGDEAVEQMIANAESSNVAQYRHEIGSYFRLNDTLYKVTNTINIGDAITVGTNCEVVVLANELEETEKAFNELQTGIAQNINDITNIFASDKAKSGSYISVYSTSIKASIDSDTQNLAVEHLTKNLLKTPYLYPNPYTLNGVTFTPQENGSIKVQGTATADVSYRLTPETPATNRHKLKAGTYTISGSPAGGSSSSYRIMLSGIGQGSLYDYGNGVSFTLAADSSYYAKILVKSGTEINTYFYPQIELGTVKTNYVPYKSETITLSNGHADFTMYEGVNVFVAENTFTVTYSVPETISLNYYGAAGDGTTDDTAAIQMALDEGVGKTIIVPNGTYLFSRTLVIKNGTKIIGSGVNTKFKLASTFTLTPYPWRTVEDPASVRYPMMRTEDNSKGCVLCNFALEGQTTTFSDTACDGLYVTGENHILENLVVNNINYFPDDFSSRTANGVGYGIRIGNANLVNVNNCKITNSGYEGLGTEDATNISITNCFFGDANQTGLQVHRSSYHIRIEGCTVQFSEGKTMPAFTMHGIEAYPLDDIVVNKCYFCRAITGIAGYENGFSFTNNIVAAGFMSVNAEIYRQNWRIIGNEFRAGGIRTIRVDNCIITDNIINCDSGYYMIILRGNKNVVDNNLGIGSVTDVNTIAHE